MSMKPELNSVEKTVNLDTMKPTSVRWRIFLMLLVLSAINYLDRAVLSIAMPAINEDLNFDPAIVGIIFSSFFWGYTLVQIPFGILADRVRPDKLIVGSAVAWGIVQTLTGFVTGSKSLIFLRTLLGVAEAPVFIGGAKLQSLWLTSAERGRGATLLTSGTPLGTAIGGPIIVVFMAWFGGWRGALIATGILTLVIAWIAWKVIKGTPATSKSMNEAERQYIQSALDEEYEAQKGTGHVKVTVKDYLKDLNFWCLNLGFFFYITVFYGLMTWGPSYLAATQNLNIQSIGSAVLIIFGSGFVGELTGGWIADTWRKKGGSFNVVMRTMLSISGIVTAVSIYSLSKTTSLTMAITLLSISLFFLRWGSLYWSFPAALSKREHIGIVGGCMNFTGNIAGIIIPIYIGVIVQATGSYNIALMTFVASGLLLVLASVLIKYNRKFGSEM
ncbi:MFS transporter [Peribacillus cavernae]|uniref:MFS transporter n=1 Tax=Peribacillus cavernae TaxID=1674310 RepID=A0A3S0VU65_9BACI|nr:MFS transporter [Peribacillus cavernae]MDQ0221120.1 ACS family D-galactonate transporter-like MFS transporter [Peribacillus cavernae]RUQ32839.1 MFS transporter [Peribacillus cavernae]